RTRPRLNAGRMALYIRPCRGTPFAPWWFAVPRPSPDGMRSPPARANGAFLPCFVSTTAGDEHAASSPPTPEKPLCLRTRPTRATRGRRTDPPCPARRGSRDLWVHPVRPMEPDRSPDRGDAAGGARTRHPRRGRAEQHRRVQDRLAVGGAHHPLGGCPRTLS